MQCLGNVFVIGSPGGVFGSRGVVALAESFGVHRAVGEEFAAVIAVGGDPETQTVTGTEDGLAVDDAVPGDGVGFEIVDQRIAGAVGVAGADDGRSQLLVGVGLQEEFLTAKLVFRPYSLIGSCLKFSSTKIPGGDLMP